MEATRAEDHLGCSESGCKHSYASSSFPEAAEVFDDLLSITVLDTTQPAEEQRFITLGQSERGRLLTIGHADSDDEIRIITAREATRKERRNYEEGIEQ